MDPNRDNEDKRASRIGRRTNEYHSLLGSIYENLVDRDFRTVKKDVLIIIMEMKCILKSIEEDDF